MRLQRAVIPLLILAVSGLAAFAVWRWHLAHASPEPVLRNAADIEAVMRPPPAPHTPFVAATQLRAQGCALPPHLATPHSPAQTPAPAAMPAFKHRNGRLLPLAGFSVDARVLSTRHYTEDREAEYAPLDFALGWHRMRDDDVVAAFEIAQQNRWYYLRWNAAPPISIEQARLESANMHLIPANREIANALAGIEKGARVRIDGWLVEVHAADGWRWRSSLTRDDHGPGGCEVVYVCGVARAQ